MHFGLYGLPGIHQAIVGPVVARMNIAPEYTDNTCGVATEVHGSVKIGSRFLQVRIVTGGTFRHFSQTG